MSYAWFAAIALLSIALILLASFVRDLSEEVTELRRSLIVVNDALQQSLEREMERVE